MARKMMERCKPASMSALDSPRARRSRSSAPANTVQVGSSAPFCLHGNWSQLMQANIHFVGDVAQVATAAGSTAIIHLEVFTTLFSSIWIALGILSADIQHRAGVIEHDMGSHAMTENLRADMPWERAGEPDHSRYQPRRSPPVLRRAWY